mgnify:CR=1 FL=1
MEGPVTGRLLYDKDGTTYLGDYYRLGVEDYTTDSIFWGATEYHCPMALFSMPLDGETAGAISPIHECRGDQQDFAVLDELYAPGGILELSTDDRGGV